MCVHALQCTYKAVLYALYTCECTRVKNSHTKILYTRYRFAILLHAFALCTTQQIYVCLCKATKMFREGRRCCPTEGVLNSNVMVYETQWYEIYWFFHPYILILNEQWTCTRINTTTKFVQNNNNPIIPMVLLKKK